MNYKKIFKSQKIRHNLLKMLSFLPDKLMLKIQYRIKLGRNLNLDNPKRYTEKIQLYKLYYRNPSLPVAVDKFEVRKFVEDKGLKNTLNTLLGVFEKAEDVDFSKLPDKFVIKTNDGGGGDNILICKDRDSLDKEGAIKKINSWLNKKNLNLGREWAYTKIPKSLIIVEDFLENESNPEGGLEDYKFFCFDGQPFCVVHDGDRYVGHKRNFYDLRWHNLHIGSDCANFKNDTPKPELFDEMLEIARKLSEGFPFVRVDLFQANGKVYFGELTFYPWSGYVQFDPDEFDFTLGEQFDVASFIPKKGKN